MRRVILVFSVFGISCGPAAAAPSWPTLDGDWDPVMVDGAVYVDAPRNLLSDNYDTPPPKPMDVVGGIDSAANGPFAAGFWSIGAGDLMFRVRVDGDPSQGGQFVWTALLNTDADSDVDWAVQLDFSGDNQVELVEALSGGPDSNWEVVLAGPPHTIGYDATVYSRFSNASGALNPPYTGSQFTGSGPVDDDYFVDIAMPLADFSSATGWSSGDPLGIAFSTSASHISDNKDRPDYSAWGNEPVIPAPGAIVLAGVGMVLVGWMRRRRAL